MYNIKRDKLWHKYIKYGGSTRVEYLYAVKVKLLSDCYIFKIFLCKLHGKHKAKIYSRFTKDKRIKHITKENHQFTKKESKKGRKNYETARKK